MVITVRCFLGKKVKRRVFFSPDLGLNQRLSQLQVLSWGLSEDIDQAARIHLLKKNFQALGYSLLFVSPSGVPRKFYHERTSTISLTHLIALMVSKKASLFLVESWKLTFLSCLYETSVTVTSK